MSQCYAWLSQIEADMKVEGKTPAATEVVNGKKFALAAAKIVSERIENEICFQPFDPVVETRYFDVTANSYDDLLEQFYMGYPLLETTLVKVGETTLTLWDGTPANRGTSDYYLHPRGLTPAYRLQGLDGRIWLPTDYSDPAAYLQAIAVTGTWGFRRRYGTEGFRASGDTVQSSPLSSSATSLTVTDADGVSWEGVTPRFSPGQLLKIESEFVRVEAVDTGTNALTITRGINGTTAAAHAQNVAISVWYPQPEIVRAVTRWVGLLYNNRAVYETFRVSGGEAGNFTSRIPQDIPEEVASILYGYRLDTLEAIV
jgi:hypothetical protein